MLLYRRLSSAFGRSGRIFGWKQLDLADSSAEQLTEYSCGPIWD